MRLLVCLTILMIFFLGFGVHTQREILTLTSEMQQIIPSVRDKLQSEQWDQAETTTLQLRQYWDQIQDRWDLFIVHEETEAVETYIARMLSYISSEKKHEALAELASLDTELGQIARKEKFSLQNVF